MIIFEVQSFILLVTIQASAGLQTSSSSLKQICRSLGGSPTNGIISCPAGEGVKPVKEGLCCVKCQPKCPVRIQARVTDVMTPGEGCFGDCLICSEMKPFPHYKDNALNKCVQCRDCELEGKFEAKPCTDMSNAQCVDHQIVTTNTHSQTQANTIADNAIPTGKQPFKGPQPTNTHTNAIIVTIAMISIAVAIVAIIVIAFKRHSYRMRSRGNEDLSRNGQVVDYSNLYESIPLNDIVTVNSNVSRLDSNQSPSETGIITHQSGSSQNDVVNGCDDMNENEVISNLPSPCLTPDSSSGPALSVHFWRSREAQQGIRQQIN